jgi:hypothetical protein
MVQEYQDSGTVNRRQKSEDLKKKGKGIIWRVVPFCFNNDVFEEKSLQSISPINLEFSQMKK